METLIRLALTAGADAGIGNLRRAGRRLAWMVVTGAFGALLLATACGFLGFALFYGLAPMLGIGLAAAATGLAFIALTVVIWVVMRLATRPRRPSMPPLETAVGLGAMGSLGGGIGNLLERHALSILLAAFVAGMVSNRRR